MKIQQTRKQYTITIPSAIAKAKGWSKGDELKIIIDNLGNVILQKV